MHVSPPAALGATTPARRGALVASGAHADVSLWGQRSPSRLGGTVVKIHRGVDAPQRALAEAAALSLTTHPHVVELLDVVPGEGDGAPGLVLPRLSTRSAADLLRDRGTVSAGEAVTLLVPILTALQHLARLPSASSRDGTVELASGVSLENVLFDPHGAPVVVGLRALPTAGPLRLSRPPGGAAGAARRITTEVAAVVHGGDSAARGRLDALLGTATTIDELVEAIYDLAEPQAIDDEPALRPSPEREVETLHPLDDLVPGLAGARAWLTRRRGGASPLAGDPSPLLTLLGRVRTRIWLIAIALVTSAVIGWSMTSEGQPEPAPRQAATQSSDVWAEPGAGASARSSSPPGKPSRREKPSPGESSPDAAVLRGDDAVAATVVLLRLRDACLAALDALCLAGVDEAGGAALESDVAAVDDPRLIERLPRLRDPAIVNRLGGVVLLSGTGADAKPASALVVRSEAGWRLRSVGAAGS